MVISYKGTRRHTKNISQASWLCTRVCLKFQIVASDGWLFCSVQHVLASSICMKNEGCKWNTNCILQIQAEAGCISQAAFRGAIGRGQPCHIWSRNANFKGSRPQNWASVNMCTRTSTQWRTCWKLFIIINWVISQNAKPSPILHIVRHRLISNVFTWVGLVSDNPLAFMCLYYS